MKKFSKFLLSILVILAMIFVVSSPVNADSGWDSDYGGGSSWDSGSSSSWDSGSSSSWDYDDHDYNSSSSGGSSDPAVVFVGVLIFVIALAMILLYDYISKKSIKTNNSNNASINDVINEHAGVWSSEHVGDFIPGYDKDKLLAELYQKFIDVQNAWMEFDYEALKKLCTDELYESYKSDLEILKAQNGKNIMNDFNLVNSRIVDIREENEKVVIIIFLEVKFHDYVINVDTNKVTRGNKNTVMDNRYNLVFVTSKGDTGICPNCGAKIESRDCSYCGSHVDSLNKDFVLSSKSRIR